MICRTYKIRLEPNDEQRGTLAHIFKFCRFLYNCALEERKKRYSYDKKSITYYEQSAQLKIIRKEFKEDTKNIRFSIMQQVLLQLEASYKNFFKNKKGFPRFKTENSFKSICFPSVSKDLKKGSVKVQGKILKIFGFKEGIKLTQELNIEGIAKQCRIVRDGDEYYLHIFCKEVPKKIIEKTGKEVGIDVGLESFVTQDDGTKYDDPRPYRTSLEKLKYRQRKLSLKKKGSKNRERQKKLVQKAHRKIRNVRDDFQHKLANSLIKEFDVIYVEDLNIKSMLEGDNKDVSKRNISDVAWGKFIFKLTYKAERADKCVIKVNPRNTSKMCSKCEKISKDLKLCDRIYECPHCGLKIDRDVNAAKNIKRLGQALRLLSEVSKA